MRHKPLSWSSFITFLLFTFLISSLGILTFSLLITPSYAQVANAWNIHRRNAANDLDFYYNTTGQTGLRLLQGGGEIQARKFSDLDNPSTYSLDPNSNSTLNALSVKGAGVGVVSIGQWSGSNAYGSIYLNDSQAVGDYNFLSSPANTNLYINRPTGRGIYMREGNGDQLTILPGGNVGIGTTNPTHKLEVRGGNSNLNGIRIGSSYPADIWKETGTGPLGIYSQDSNTVIQPYGGRVGIGTTSPAATLDVAIGAYSKHVGLGNWNNQSSVFAFTDGFGAWQDLYVNPGGSTFISSVSGNVGIGTSTPLTKLHVSGFNDGDGIVFHSTKNDAIGIQTVLNGQAIGTYGDYNVLTLQGTAGVVGIGTGVWTPRGRLSVASGNGDMLNIYQPTDDTMAIGVSLNDQPIGTYGQYERLRINTGGDTEIGKIRCINTVCPDNGAIRMDGHLRLNAWGGGGVLVNADSGQGGWGVSGGSWQFAVYDGLGGWKFFTRADGNSYCAVACNDNSDERLKKNITPISNALDRVLALKGVNFYWDQSRYPKKTQFFPEKQQMGFIAQQVEPYIPELVLTDEEGFKALDYAKISALIVEGIKEQQKQIESGKTKNDKLEELVKKQQEEIDQLKKAVRELQGN